MIDQEQWQEQFDSLFPTGARVFIVEDVPEYLGDAFDFLTPDITVMEMVDGEPVVRVEILGMYRWVEFRVKKMEPWNNGILVTTDRLPNFDPDDGPDYVFLSAHFGERTAGILKELREQARQEAA